MTNQSVTEPVTFTETDLALVEALQVAPRASWTSVSAALGIGAATAARRWARLAAAGAAWVTGGPGVALWNARCVAFVEVDCVPARRLGVAEALAADRHALSVELTTGAADLFLTVAAADLTALSRYLLERLDRIPGVTATRVGIATRLYRDGSSWRLGALPREAITTLRVPTAAAPVTGPPPGALSADNRALLVQLGLDGRSSYAELATAAGISEPTARRHVAQLVRTGAVLLRADVAGALAGWPVLVYFSVDVPTSRLTEAARAVSQLRHVRLCATLAGSRPLVVAAWLRDLDEIHRFELSLTRMAPGLAVAERMITVRPVKRMGRLLDQHGRAVSAVPMDVWCDPLEPLRPDSRSSMGRHGR